MSMEHRETSSRERRRAQRTYIINRRQRVMNLYFARKPQWQIAIELGLTPDMVSEDIKATVAAYKRHYNIDTMALIVEEVASLGWKLWHGKPMRKAANPKSLLRSRADSTA
jgi:DNA-binding CsgD family transcriptional regulator